MMPHGKLMRDPLSKVIQFILFGRFVRSLDRRLLSL